MIDTNMTPSKIIASIESMPACSIDDARAIINALRETFNFSIDFDIEP